MGLSPPAMNMAVNVSGSLRALGIELQWAIEANATLGPSRSGGGNVTAPTPLVPCSDPRGCPDLIVDEEQMLGNAYESYQFFPPASCSVVENSTLAGARTLLRFSFATPNIGSGDLIIGAPTSHLSWFTWSACHGHYHFKQYAEYRLWTVQGYLDWVKARRQHPSWTSEQVLDANPALRAQYVAGHKQGFCAIDIQTFLPGMPGHYFSCTLNQGVSVWWEDVYSSALDGQWIDVTGLPIGPYVLNAEVNPQHFYQESDYTNNEAAALVLHTA
jgi:hypothetical protein